MRSQQTISKNKYRAVKTVVDGITFHSKKEAERYKILALLEAQGKIDNLRLQPRIALMVNGKKLWGTKTINWLVAVMIGKT